MKKLITVLLIAVLALGAWYFHSLRTLKSGAHGEIPDKFLARAEKHDIESTVELSGDVTPDTTLDVKSEVSGKIKALHVIPGQQVQPGELLVEIDDHDLLTDKASAQTEIEGAKIIVEKNARNLQRAEELFSSKLINREAFDNVSAESDIAKNDLEKSQHRLDGVEDKLRKTKILAPAAGTVLSVSVVEGQVVVGAASVNSGTTLMQIADLARLLVTTNVNQVDVAKLQRDQKVALSTESIKDLDLQATITFIAPVASTKNNVKGFEVKALIDHPDPRLRPGMTVNITVPIASAAGVVSVPISAVFKGENNTRVVYVRKGEGSEKREVQIGVTDLERAEIKSGLQLGEEILLVEPRTLQKKT
ncbi:MAG: rane fusion protein macrolide-specific efflux system [Chthoniobacter sp.]|jgi:RND family efflux transporter MFP subunit|nr:rane fusion protein macrolide-specific efflux system [Chthoniobacter sp.]